MFCCLLAIGILATPPLLSFAGDGVSASGQLDLRGIGALEKDSATEGSSLTGTFKLDAKRSAWKLHFRIEGGWDGSVRKPIRDRSPIKNFRDVYQSNTPFLEAKEFYLGYGTDGIDVRAGIQRFAWGRLDEYPLNDLLNPWDYTRFLRKPLESRKIGVPSLSAGFRRGEWTFDAVWVPWLVPYRLAMPYERWSGIPASAFAQIPDAQIIPAEPDLPPRTAGNGNAGARIRRNGGVEWSLTLFHGYDPRPVFKTTALVILPQGETTRIDPGYVPSFRKITLIGLDAAAGKGAWSLRAEAAFTFNRHFNIRRGLWGYPAVPAPGVHPLNEIERKSDVLEYGIGADYRLFEDGLLTMQAQQAVLFDRTGAYYERKAETLLLANIKVGWWNQKVETNGRILFNPEHGDSLVEANGWYVFTDSWKAGVAAVILAGPPESLFGRFARNDQVEAELVFAW